MKRFVGISALIYILFLPVVEAVAQGVYVRTPTTLEFWLAPGDSAIGRIEIVNETERAQRADISKADYRYTADGAVEYGEPGTLPQSNATWINMGAASLGLNALEVIPLDFHVAVPDTARAGATYWSVIIVGSEPELPTPATARANNRIVRVNISERFRFATLVAVHVMGEGTRELRLDNVRLVTQDSVTVLQADLENAGTLGLRPQLTIEAYDTNGRLAGTFVGEANQRLLLPGTSYVQSTGLGALAPGRYTFVVIADVGSADLFGTQVDLEIKGRADNS